MEVAEQSPMSSPSGRELAIHLDAVELALAEQLAARDGVTLDVLINRTMHDMLVELFSMARQQQRPGTGTVVPFKRPLSGQRGISNMTDESPEATETTAEATPEATEITEPENATPAEPTAEATDIADDLASDDLPV